MSVWGHLTECGGLAHGASLGWPTGCGRGWHPCNCVAPHPAARYHSSGPQTCCANVSAHGTDCETGCKTSSTLGNGCGRNPADRGLGNGVCDGGQATETGCDTCLGILTESNCHREQVDSGHPGKRSIQPAYRRTM